jgi:hypothetical protein
MNLLRYFKLLVLAPLMFTSQFIFANSNERSSLQFQVAEKAALAVSQFQKRANGRLDYSENSLSVVDEMLAEAAQYSKEMDSVSINSLVELMGTYVLEVGRRKYGGQYQWSEENSQPVLVVGEPKFKVSIMTFYQIRSRISGDTGSNIVFFFQGFSAKVKSAEVGSNTLYN